MAIMDDNYGFSASRYIKCLFKGPPKLNVPPWFEKQIKQITFWKTQLRIERRGQYGGSTIATTWLGLIAGNE
jgi:hypothetical protein